MKRIAGIDLSLTSTGIAVLTQIHNGTVTANTATIRSTGKVSDTPLQKANRRSDLAGHIMHVAGTCDAAMVESPSYASKSAYLVQIYWLYQTIVDTLALHCIPTAIIAPTAVKKWATGTGQADKAAVAVALCRLWPDVDIVNSDTADALAMGSMLGQRLDWTLPFGELVRHTETLDKVKWPQGLPEVGVAA